MTRAKGYISHHLDDRARFYLPFEKGNDELFHAIEQKLAEECVGVRRVETNPMTGSVLVHFQGEISDILECARKNNLFDIDPSLDRRKTWAQDVLSRLDHVDRKIVHATQGDLNLASIAALGLLGAGAFQLSRKQFFPAASSLITDAMRLLIRVNRNVYQNGQKEGQKAESSPVEM